MFKCMLLVLLLMSEAIILVVAEVYYVQPPKHHSSVPCTTNCSADQQCHTMDYYASNSHIYFKPDKKNITLYFLCGVHNCTNKLLVSNLSAFSIVGATPASVVISMPMRIYRYQGDTFFTAINVSTMKIENITIIIPSIGFEGTNCHLIIKNSKLLGYKSLSTMSLISVLSITHSIVSLVNCTLKQNVFIRSTARGVIVLKNCLVEQYNLALYSAIHVGNSTVVLSRNVHFINNVPLEFTGHSMSGGVLRMSDSVLYTKKSSNVSFNNNAVSVYGGSVYMERCRMYIWGHLVFANNTAAQEGGALYMFASTVIIERNAIVTFFNNSSPNAGAVSFVLGQFDVKNAHVLFLYNTAREGGALQMHSSNLNITISSLVGFINNSADLFGGSTFLILARLCISTNSNVFFANNTALQGGAIYLYASVIKITSGSIILKNNTAMDVGGGLYAVIQTNAPCFYYPRVGYTNYTNGTIIFEDNSAKNGIGQHIYGSSVHDSRCNYEVQYMKEPFCLNYHSMFSFHPDSTSHSIVSSDAKRVCLCDSYHGQPQCTELSKVFVADIEVYPGETFHLSIVIVGYDFGLTKGTVHAGFLGSLQIHHLLSDQYDQWIGSAQCIDLNYTIFSFSKQETMYLHSQNVPINIYGNITSMNQSIKNWHTTSCIDEDLLNTPVFVNISVLSCPPGFHQQEKNGQPSGCICYQILSDNNFKCQFINKTGYHMWNSSMWVSVTSDKVFYNYFCPFDYCKPGQKVVNLGKLPDNQCTLNHAGILCGGCKKNYSLAIGSSKCIYCSNNASVALLIFFAAAGVLLVLFILALNLTVTQGLINGLVFYANIVWTYKPIWFPPQGNIIVSVVQVFIAWLNLDFGIEGCFVREFNAFIKTWLQFLFPFYIWAIAGSIIIASRYSSRITEVIGNRAVPLLATLFLLSYMKLFRTIIEALAFTLILSYPEKNDQAVWYIDGNYSYCRHPHIYLFVAALLALVLLWCPYTFILLLVQWLRRVSHLKCLKWVTKFTPFYDACFAPLKDKHHYWFGVLLLVRGLLLLIFSLTFAIVPDINLLILFIILVLLLLYTVGCCVYKERSVKILEMLLLGNLIILTGTSKLSTNRTIILVISVCLAFVQFCGIVLWSLIRPFIVKRRQGYVNMEDTTSDFIHRRLI